MAYHQALGRHPHRHHHRPGPSPMPYPYPYPYPGYSPWWDVPVGERILLVSETDEEKEERKKRKKRKAKKGFSGLPDFIGGSAPLTLGVLGIGAYLLLKR